MSKCWVTTSWGNQVDVSIGERVYCQYHDMRQTDMPGVYELLLYLGFNEKPLTKQLAVFSSASDCTAALGAFIKQGWLVCPGDPSYPVPEPYLHGIALNPALVTGYGWTGSNVTGEFRLRIFSGAELDVGEAVAYGLGSLEVVQAMGREVLEQVDAYPQRTCGSVSLKWPRMRNWPHLKC